ncbi:hypothetical protein SAMN04488101_102227 [Pedobacter nyackensis]|uniref:Uncharacterized protein n=1 Tax=Pedobacter nyackensis TaxID=475255 RepID=A0A1W2BA05_9SPHI|nr:hypothetical protein SAMN04488101_102227 [Pedobacter nyackensis]
MFISREVNAFRLFLCDKFRYQYDTPSYLRPFGGNIGCTGLKKRGVGGWGVWGTIYHPGVLYCEMGRQIGLLWLMMWLVQSRETYA